MFHAGTMWSSLFSAEVQSSALELQNSAHTFIWLYSWLAQAGLEGHGLADKQFQGQNTI